MPQRDSSTTTPYHIIRVPHLSCPEDWVDSLTRHEQRLVESYRCIDRVTRLAIRCYLFSGDIRLVGYIFDQCFLGILPVESEQKLLDAGRQLSGPVEFDEPPLVG